MVIKSEKITMLMIVTASMAVVASAAATMADKEKECAEEMGNLASCIPFVSGTAKKPTAQCCEDTQKVKTNKPKCLCVLIKESTDPSLGLPINTTLALQMPAACNIDAKVSDCASILNLPKDSLEAKIFKGADGESSSSSSADSTSPGSSSLSSSSSPQSALESNSRTTSATPSSSDAANAIITTKGSFIMLIIASCFAWIFI